MKKRKIILFSFSALIICLIAVLSCIFINSSKQSIDELNSGLIYQTESSSIIKLSASTYSQNGLESIVINADCGDSYLGSGDYLVWEFINSTDSNYLSLTVSSDKMSATVQQLKSFDYQIKLKVSSYLNPNVFAYVYIDCYEKTINYSGVISTGNGLQSNGLVADFTSKSFITDLYNTIFFLDNFKGVKDVGSVSTNTTLQAYWYLSPEWIDFCDAMDLGNYTEFVLIESESGSIGSYFEELTSLNLSDLEIYKGIYKSMSNSGYFDDMTSVHVGFIEFVFVDNYNDEVVSSHREVMDLYLNFDSDYIIKSITLDQSQLYF